MTDTSVLDPPLETASTDPAPSRPRRRRRRLLVWSLVAAAALAVVMLAGAVGTSSGSHHAAVTGGPARAVPAPKIVSGALPPSAVSSGSGAAVAGAGSAGGTAGIGASGGGSIGVGGGGVSSGATDGSGSTGGVEAAPAAAPGAAAPVSVPSAVPPLASKVIDNGSVTLDVGRGGVSGTVTRLTSITAAAGGYLASSSISDPGSGGSPSADLTLRIPSAVFSTTLDQVRRLGKALNVTSSGQDVTAQYVDLQARLDSLVATRTQLQQILAKATAIGDVLSVESQLTDIQTQIEQLQGQQRVLDDQTSYGTLAVHVEEAPVVVPPPRPHPVPSGVSRAWGRATHTFTTGLENILGWGGGLALFLVVAGALAVAVRLGWAGGRRWLRSRQAAEPAA